MNRLKLCAYLTILFNVCIFSQENANHDSPFDKTSRPKVGIALAGGGALGFAHLGVLKVIDSLNIPIDYVSGTSMGGLVGGMYAMGYDVDSMIAVIKRVDWTNLFSDRIPREDQPYFEKLKDGRYGLILDLEGITPKLPSGLIAGQKIRSLFLSLSYPYESLNNFDSLAIPFRCVAADLITGSEVVLKDGSLAEALRATMSIPSAFTPVERGDMLLIDGGVINNFPVDVIKEMGSDITIGLNLSTGEKTKESLQTLIDIMDRTADLPRLARLKENIGMADIYIESDVSNHSFADFSEKNIWAVYKKGYEAAKKNIDKLIELKKELSSYSSSSNLEERHETNRRMREEYKINPPIIHSVKIEGNESFEFNFIYNNLGIKTGSIFNAGDIAEKISRFYGLGYFKSISYDLRKARKGYVIVTVHVKEHKLNKLLASYRYDDVYKLIALIGIESTSFLIKGSRLLMEYQFGGLRKFNFNYSYLSRTLDVPLYPYIAAEYKSIPVNIFDEPGNKIALYKDRSWDFSFGAGTALIRNLNLSASIGLEFMDIVPVISGSADVSDLYNTFSDRLVKFNAHLIYDSLNDILVPGNGFMLKIKYEASDNNLGSDRTYNKIEISFDAYKSFLKDHIIGVGYRHLNSLHIPVYKMFYFGGPDQFWGIDYNQAFGSRFNVGRIDYLFHISSQIYAHGVFNFAFDYALYPYNEISQDNFLSGYGAGLKMKTIFGVLEVMYAMGDESIVYPGEKTNRLYFTAGFKL